MRLRRLRFVACAGLVALGAARTAGTRHRRYPGRVFARETADIATGAVGTTGTAGGAAVTRHRYADIRHAAAGLATTRLLVTRLLPSGLLAARWLLAAG